MKHLITLLCLIQFQLSLAQISDDFSDGDFTNDPTWSGDNADFDAAGFELQLNASVAGQSYLSATQTELGETTWEFLVALDFSPSNSNYVKIYLVSDQEDITQALNGYYIRIGENLSGDVIKFYRQDDDDNEELLFSGTTNLSSSFNVRIQVVRNSSGSWQINADSSGGSTFASEGSSFTDNNHTTTTNFGFHCIYTVSNITKFHFDDIAISTATPSFGISTLANEANNSIRITFNQNVDEISGETLSNYSLNYGFGQPISAERHTTNLDEVLLTFNDDFVNNNYTLNIDQVENEAQDDIISNLNQTLDVELQTPFRNIVINEMMADPSPAVGLPEVEFVELYNASNQAINIGDFDFDGEPLEDFVLLANEYITLTDEANTGAFSGNVMGLSVSLPNAGSALLLYDNLGNLVDSVSYTDDWYSDANKDDGGYSLEQINPGLACSYENNWTASNSTNGGTPGAQNSVYDNSPDTDGPNLINFVATDANTFVLTFDEPMDEVSLNGGTYIFDNGISENGIMPTSPGFLSALVDVMPDLTSGTTYTITVSDVTDCSANAVQTNSLSFTYDTDPPEFERIVIKSSNQIDVIFNENLDPTIAETESNYSSNHSEENPSAAVLNENNPSAISLSFAEDFEFGVENTLTIDNLEDEQGNRIASSISETFILSQDVDSVYVIGVNLLDIYYNTDVDEVSALTVSNYEVDDEVGHPSNAFLDSDDDRIVHLAFANNFDDNKELTLSISDVKNSADEFLTTPEINFEYDTSPPKLDTLYTLSSRSLALVFSEKVKKRSAESKENYEYEDIFPIDAILEADQKTLILEFAEDFEREVVYELHIDEVKDLYDNEIKTRITEAFVYDVFAPELDSIIVRSANELILWFNEDVSKAHATQIANYDIGELGTPSAAIRNFVDQSKVNLELSGDLPETADLSLVITDMQDLNGNTIEESITTSFDFDIFYVSLLTPQSNHSLEIEFNKTPSPSSKTVLSNYTLDGSVATAINFSSDRIATLTFSTVFEQDSTYLLQIANIADEDDDPLSQNDYSFVFDHRFMKAELTGQRNITLEFSAVLDINEDFDLSDFSASPSLGPCQAAIVNSTYLHQLHLTFNETLNPDIPYTVAWQNLEDAFGYVIPDYSTTVINDQTPPSLADYLILDENTIWLQYSEPLNETSAEFLLNYQIAPSIGYPTEARYTAADSSVLLEFSLNFLESTDYTLALDNIEDLADNALEAFDITFTFEPDTPPGFGDLIITEIMADPTPEVGLSDREYLEIFNTTDHTISLGGISLVDESGSTTILSGEIESRSYMVLTAHSATDNFKDVSVLGVTSFPSFNNSGETISLYADKQQIFSTSYTTDWYKDGDKDSGGWSLEMIDTGNPCGEYKNWTASTHPSGGTPGIANSVETSNPDNFGPQLVSAIATSANTIRVTLDEKLHPQALANSEILVTPTVAIANATLQAPINTQILINLSDNLESGHVYEIELNKVKDCLMNTIQEEQNTTTFRLPEEAEALDILINEVLFNPRTGGVDFVEIYNNSEKAINLLNWTVGDKTEEQKIIAAQDFVLNPAEYLALTPDPSILIIDYPNGDADQMLTMSSFPSLSDAEDSVILINNQGVVIDQMEYQDDYHFNLLDDDEGVSLERVSFEAESTNPDSWKSAASTVGFATPAVVNSQFRATQQSTATVSIEPRVFVPDNTGMNDYTTITYLLSQSGNFANVHIYSTNGVLVKTLAEGELLSTTGFFTWDGISNNGTIASVGYYVVIFEIFDGLGNKSVQKETVVLGAKF